MITSVAVHSAQIAYSDDGDPLQRIDFYKLESAVYGEYGLSESWSLTARFAVQDVRLQRDDTMDARTGIGASQIAIKRKIADLSKWVFSVQGGVSIPGNAENGLDIRLGEGDLEWEVRALAGRSFSLFRRHGFLDFQVARQFRNATIPDEWRLDMTAGIYPAKNIMLMGQVFVLHGDRAVFSGTRTLRSVKTQGSLVWSYSPTSAIQFYVMQPVSGRNVVADRAIGLGWWRKF